MAQSLEGRNTHVDNHLSNVAINYSQNRWIGEMIFPVVPVPKQSDTYVVYDQADLFRRENTRRSRASEAHIIQHRVSSAAFYCDNYALKANVTIEDRVNADPIFVRRLEEGKVRHVTDGLMLDWEVRVANQINATTAVGSSAAVSSTWTDHANSNPLENIWTAMDNIRNSTGYEATDLILGVQEWHHFRRNTNVRNAARNPNVSAGDRLPSEADIAELLELKRVHVGRAFVNTAQEAIAQSLVNVWSGAVILYYRPDAPSVEEPSFGYSFRWSAPGLPNMQVERHPFDPKKKVDEIEVGYYQDEVVTASALSYLLTGAWA